MSEENILHDHIKMSTSFFHYKFMSHILIFFFIIFCHTPFFILSQTHSEENWKTTQQMHLYSKLSIKSAIIPQI